MDAGAVHPLTGPVLVKGAQPGDVLEIEMVDISPQPHAFTAIMPGLGFLRDLYHDPYLVKWRIADGWATSRRAARRADSRRAVHGRDRRRAVARSASRLDRARAGVPRSRRLVMVPDAAGAVPGTGRAATEGLRTMSPRENGGNMDIKQITKGSKLSVPVTVEGALFSVGDGHFAQGDGEVCVTAVEMGATAVVRFRVHEGRGERRSPRAARVQPPRLLRAAASGRRRSISSRAMGMPIRDDGVNEGENLTLACRNALLNMIDLLQERGWTREQAYVICSVAADLRISNVVDVPNYVVSALLPEAIFQG